VAFGIDVTDDCGPEVAGFLAAGLRLDVSTVLTASAVHDPPRPNRVAGYRRLDSEDDWSQSVELNVAGNSSAGAADDRDFCERRAAAARRLSETGRGSWFGAFDGGRLVAQFGLFLAGSGLARFQNVETHPLARRQRLAGSLVYHACRYGIGELGAGTLVIVADADSAAARLYQSVGFVRAEAQIGLERPPPVPTPTPQDP